MAINQEQIDLLYRAQDMPLLPDEKRELELALERSAELRAEQEKLQRLRSLFEAGLPRDDPQFTERMMGRLEEKLIPRAWLRRIAAACLLLIAGAFAGLYIGEGSLNADTLIGVEGLQPEDATALTDELSLK